MLDNWIFETIGRERSRKQLDEWILKRLIDVCSYARENSKFYRERIPENMTCMEDFHKLPFTRAEDLKEHGRRMLCVPASSVRRIVTLETSGSTGDKKRVYFSPEDLECTIDYFQHGIGEFICASDRVVTLFPGNTPDGLNDLLRQAVERIGASFLYFGYPKGRTIELLNVLKDEQITFIVGPPAAVSEAARQAGAEKLKCQIGGVLLAAQFVSEEAVDSIERAWHCRIYEHYSMTETGYAGAVGCRIPGGYHIWENGLYYEIIDPDTGSVLPDGVHGEIVVTTLTERAMPVIRYRTGDTGSISPRICSCGSILKRLSRVDDRPVGKKFEPSNYQKVITF